MRRLLAAAVSRALPALAALAALPTHPVHPVLGGDRGQEPDPVAARARGRADAPITIYEMSDFQCPYCRAFALTTLPELERDYIRPGKVRLVYVNLPLGRVHPNATAAAEAAMCAARQRRFWPLHDLLFRHQPEWAELAAPQAYFLALGDSAGLDHRAFAACLATRATAAEVAADAERAARAGARSTPSFYIEGGLLEGAAPASVFRAVLDSIYRTKTAGGAGATTRPR